MICSNEFWNDQFSLSLVVLRQENKEGVVLLLCHVSHLHEPHERAERRRDA